MHEDNQPHNLHNRGVADAIVKEGRTRNDADGMLWANINHDHPQHALIITDIYPQGPSSARMRASNFVVPPGQMVHEQLASFSVPIKAEKGRP